MRSHTLRHFTLDSDTGMVAETHFINLCDHRSVPTYHPPLLFHTGDIALVTPKNTYRLKYL